MTGNPVRESGERYKQAICRRGSPNAQQVCLEMLTLIMSQKIQMKTDKCGKKMERSIIPVVGVGVGRQASPLDTAISKSNLKLFSAIKYDYTLPSSNPAPRSVCCCHSDTKSCLFVTPWTAACQFSRSFTISWSLLKLMFTESVRPSNHLILCHPLLLPSVFPSIGVFSNGSALCIQRNSFTGLQRNMCEDVLGNGRQVKCPREG